MKHFNQKKAIQYFIFALSLFAVTTIHAQRVGIGTTSPDSSALLEVRSTTKGFLPPRMTQAQRNAIVNPAPGLMIWCTDCGVLGGASQIYNGSKWTGIAGRLGRNYYVKEKKYGGNDAHSGLTQDQAWETLTAVNNHMSIFQPGDSILFERGSYFYGSIKIERSGTEVNPIVFSTYGTGEKPVFFAAKQINDVSIVPYHQWVRVTGTNIYEKQDDTFVDDVANLIFDNIDSFVGVKKMTETRQLNSQGEFWFDYATNTLSLYSDEDPQTKYKSIQSVRSINAIEFPHNDGYIVFENLKLKFYGYCVVEQKGSNCTFKNLDISFIGGGNNNPQIEVNGVVKKAGRRYYDENPNISNQRFGNGLQMWANVHDVTITGCRIDNIYDAGISPQGLYDYGSYEVKNIYMRNNVISNCEYSFEFFERGPYDWGPTRIRNENIITHDIYFENNTCINAGGGWGHSQRPNKWATHVRLEGFDGTKSNIFIRNNIFYGSAVRLYWSVFNDAEDIGNIISDYNDFYQNPENSAKPFGRLGSNDYTDLISWQAAISKEFSSISEVDPLFVNYPSDLHLKAGSPVIGKGIDVGFGKDIGAYQYKAD